MNRILATLLFVLLCPLSALAQDAPLRFGLFPSLSTRVLLEAHLPLADYLSWVSSETLRPFRSYGAEAARRLGGSTRP